MKKSSAEKAARSKIDYTTALKAVIRKYNKLPHPLTYENGYQLLVKVVLSAQTNDALINKIAPPFFEKYPDLASLAAAAPEDLFPLLKGVRNFANKSRWLHAIALKLSSRNIPQTLDELTELPGIGRKSASVILRELGGTGAGVIVDLHVLRVAPRIGISKAQDAGKMEKDIAAWIPPGSWADAGMCLSFLGRDVCRPTPVCEKCVIQSSCETGMKSVPGRKPVPAKRARKKPARK